MWWRCFLVDGLMEGLLMTGEGLKGCGPCVCVCVCVHVNVSVCGGRVFHVSSTVTVKTMAIHVSPSA